MYKVQLDDNGYFTGSYAIVGDVENSVNAESLPQDERKYFTAYKGIPTEKQVEESYIDGEEEKTRLVDIIVYEWELDEAKKSEIDSYIPTPQKTETELLQEQLAELQAQNEMLTECVLEMSEIIYA